MNQSDNRKVKVGIVGCGVVATAYYLPYLVKMDTVELVAVCDLYQERTAACARLFGAQAEYLDYDEMIERRVIRVLVPTSLKITGRRNTMRFFWLCLDEVYLNR